MFEPATDKYFDSIAYNMAICRKGYRFWFFGRRKNHGDGAPWIENDKRFRKRILKTYKDVPKVYKPVGVSWTRYIWHLIRRRFW